MNNFENSLISIITPTFNSESFIKNTIESVLKQSYTNWELLITDDCSTDKTVQIVEQFCKNDSRIKLFILNKNSGPGVARNNSLKNVNGRFIAFLDSDDEWISGKLYEQLEFMKKFSAPICYTGYTFMDENLKAIKSKVEVPFSINLDKYLKTTIISMPTAMIDKAKVGEFKFSKIRSRQDGVLWIELLKKGHIAYGLNKQLLKVRLRPKSISANKLKAAYIIWKIYRKYAKLNIIKTLYYFSQYIFNNIKRRYVKKLFVEKRTT